MPSPRRPSRLITRRSTMALDSFGSRKRPGLHGSGVGMRSSGQIIVQRQEVKAAHKQSCERRHAERESDSDADRAEVQWKGQRVGAAEADKPEADGRIQ